MYRYWDLAWTEVAQQVQGQQKTDGEGNNAL